MKDVAFGSGERATSDEAKPFTMEVVERAYRHTPGFERAEDGVVYSLRATVEALDALRAKVRRLREALEWSIEESDPSPCPYCGVGGKCLPHLVLAELEDA